MDKLKKPVEGIISSVGALVGFSVLIASIAFYPEIGVAQATQTGELTRIQTMENKPTFASNLTRQDVDPILNNLFVAREEMVQGNSPSAFDALNAATLQLFNLTVGVGDMEDEAISQLLDPLRKPIERARNHLLQNNNTTAAILNLNAADSEFIKLTLKLS